jgi:murein DD-endopeptidase MepM/ murein hydrolase activator NlpD
MVDSIEIGPDEVRSAVVPVIGNALGSPFVNGAYPSQDGTFIPGFCGEYRGTYGNQWNPQFSLFGAPRAGGRTHGGMDVYSLLGTPLVAVVDGELDQVLAADGDPLGNRVWLTFNANGENLRLIYGHLSSFDGAPRSVLKGDVIGSSGCTGNADYDGTCSGHNRCSMSSAHVHLQLVSISDGTKMDPAQALGWSVRYQDDQRNIPCEQFPAATG